jgi:hypothetical protein
MMMKHGWIAVLALGLSTAALAQDDDDDLAPLVPVKPGTQKAKQKPKAKAPAKPKPKPKPSVADDDLAPLVPIATKGELSIKLTAPLAGAMVNIDGKDIGVLPLGPQTVPAGERTVTVKRPGYAAFVKKVVVPGGKLAEVEVKLVPAAGVLSVSSDVVGAKVLLNGRPIGTVPLTDVEVPPGPAEVTVLKEGYREDSQKVTFVAGRDYALSVKLQPAVDRTLIASDRPVEPTLTPGLSDTSSLGLVQTAPASEPITSKWYFWVAVAAGVAAVAAGTAVGVVASQPPELTEAAICGSQGCHACIGLSCMGRTASMQGLFSSGY